MIKMQAQVQEFMNAMGQTDGSEYRKPSVKFMELRVKLIEEEAKELVDAIKDDDLVEVIDGVCDLIYVALGTVVAAGIDLEPFWEEVHQTNMAKLGGPVNSYGKHMKPPGWKPPRIKEMLLSHVDKLQVQLLKEEMAKEHCVRCHGTRRILDTSDTMVRCDECYEDM